MNELRDKARHSKYEKVKPKTRETQYMKYRSYKPKCVESRVAGYVKTKKVVVENAGMATTAAAAAAAPAPAPAPALALAPASISSGTKSKHQPQHLHSDGKIGRGSHGGIKATARSSSHHQPHHIVHRQHLVLPSNLADLKKTSKKRSDKKDVRVSLKRNGSNQNNENGAGGGGSSNIAGHVYKNNRKMPHVDEEANEERNPKPETVIQTTDLRKAHHHAQHKVKQHQHKKYKTFDIASFPRVFSTSDLMEKMNENEEEAPSRSRDAREKCEFQNVGVPTSAPPPASQTPAPLATQAAAPSSAGASAQLVSSPDLSPPPPQLSDSETAQLLDFKNDNLDIEIMRQQVEADELPVLRNMDSMVFHCAQPVVEVAKAHTCANDPRHPVRPGRMRTLAGAEERSPDEPLLVQSLTGENEAVRTRQTEQQAMLDNLHACVHKLKEDLRSKATVEQALQQTTNLLRDARSEIKLSTEQRAKLEAEVREKVALVDELMKRNEELTAAAAGVQTGGLSHRQLLTLPGEEASMLAELRCECESLRRTNGELCNDVGKYQAVNCRLKAMMAEREEALRASEGDKMAVVRQLNAYETEMACLRAANDRLGAEKEELEARNKRLLNVLALNHVLALSKPFARVIDASNSAAGVVVVKPKEASSKSISLDGSRKRNRLQEIKNFNTSYQKFTAIE